MLKAMAITDLDDTALMMRCARGEAPAFRVLASRLHPPMLRLAVRILGDRAEAEDALQAALVKLWQNAARFEAERAAVGAWFRRIVVNACLDRRRALKPVASLDAVAEAAADGADPHTAAEAADRYARVNAAVAGLLPRQRAAIALFYGDGATMAEIATILETTPKAVEGLLARARAELAQRLQAETKE